MKVIMVPLCAKCGMNVKRLIYTGDVFAVYPYMCERCVRHLIAALTSCLDDWDLLPPGEEPTFWFIHQINKLWARLRDQAR